MHAILANLVSSFIQSSCQDEMENAGLCLETLAYCGCANPVARRFHEKAQAVYNTVLECVGRRPEALKNPHRRADERQNINFNINLAESKKTPQRSTQANHEDPEVFPISHYGSIEELSLDWLRMLCRPFGDPSYREGVKDSLKTTCQSDPTRYE
ncbi:hypothetical protein ANO14919_003360 [Xylariales sp. No.14919]|nr:hypothetical protein ANO14919_003360 [Xylariales sp. No.14919]